MKNDNIEKAITACDNLQRYLNYARRDFVATKGLGGVMAGVLLEDYISEAVQLTWKIEHIRKVLREVLREAEE